MLPAAGARAGLSLLADSFAVATAMQERDPAGFELLSRVSRPFDYADQPGLTALSADRRPISLDRHGNITAVYYNNRSAGPVVDADPETVRGFYAAWQAFGKLANSPEFVLEYQLKAGECMVMDNTRTMHGRTGWEAGAVERHLQGCYVDIDELRSRLRALEAKPLA
eukprot:SAG22_NODE_2263_length_2774_cov_6.118879_3_plen_167_part_00